MNLTYSIVCKHRDKKTLKQICYDAKNLYNATMYMCRNNYFKNRESKNTLEVFLFYNELNSIMKSTKEYKALPSQTAQQVIKCVDKSWKSFRKSIIEYSKNPSKFTGKPKIPKYKDKNGCYIAIYPSQNLNVKHGKIKLPKTQLQIKLPSDITNENLKELRIVPNCNLFVIEIVYDKNIDNVTQLDSSNVIGVDIGVNNLLAVSSNQNGIPTFLINGKPLKSINQYYNKMIAKELSRLTKGKDIKIQYTNKMNKLVSKRNFKIKDYLHKSSKRLIDLCKLYSIGTIIIGKNIGWKQNIDIGKRSNQNFVQIPFDTLIKMIEYKAKLSGIQTITTEESYTSKIDHHSYESLGFHDNYFGKRIKRGLFLTKNNITINADINGSIGIMRKVVGDAFLKEIIVNRGFVSNPVKMNIF